MSKHNTTFQKGEVIDNTYEIQFFIGEGAFGEVYRVKHKFMGLQALKLLKQEYVDNTDIEQFLDEAKILSKITHPNVVRVFDANCFEYSNIQYYYITMGFVSGETLRKYLLRELRVEINLALSIQFDILSGLMQAHGNHKPIIHRDISSDNILLSYDEEIPKALLSDFGLARSVEQISNISNAGGKYLYMAPECFWNVSLQSSDVFSAGVVFYQLLTGVFPWKYQFDKYEKSKKEIIDHVMESRKTSPLPPSVYNDDCTDEIDSVVMKSIEKQVENRYNNACEFYDDLNRILQ